MPEAILGQLHLASAKEIRLAGGQKKERNHPVGITE
jgi:hypothetical protein